MKKYSDITLVDSTLLPLWNLFDKSPKKLAMLENVQEISDQKPLKMIMPSTTRWLSHRDGCLRVHARYSEIIDALDQVYVESRDPEAMGIKRRFLRKSGRG